MNFKFILLSIFSLVSSIALAQGDLSPYLRNYTLPSLAIGVIQNDKVQIVATGFKNAETLEPIHYQDTFHLGSQAKAMTAFLINQEVKAGRLTYETLVQSFYPFTLHPDFKNLKIKDLILHEGGISRGIPNAHLIVKNYPNDFTLQRYKVAEDLLTSQAAYQLGTSSNYSNAGYVILGSILERIHKRSVEDIFSLGLFVPLKMASCNFGFGHSATGHYVDSKTNKLVPLKEDNFQLFASAGTIYCSLQDWGKFLSYQMKAIQKKEAYLWQASKKNYTLGAMFLKQDAQGTKYFWHNGTNCINYVDQVMIPSKNRIMMMATNRGGDEKITCDDKRLDELRDLFDKLFLELNK